MPSLEPSILLLKLFGLHGLVDLHPAELLLPAVEGLLAYLLLATDVHDRLPASISLPKNADLLFYRVSFAFHCTGPSYSPRLTIQAAQFW